MFISDVWVRMKHWVLDIVHPMPPAIDIFPGATGTVKQAIVRRVLAEVDIPGLRMCAHGDTEDEFEPAAWPNGDASEEVVGHTGCLAVCRYVGRLWRLYPVHPVNAMIVDSSLERLSRLLVDLEEYDGDTELLRLRVGVCMQILEDHMEEDAEWLENMNTSSLADVCWAGAFSWVSNRMELFPEDTRDQFPKLEEWWRRMSA